MVTQLYATQEINDLLFDQPVNHIHHINLSGKNALFDVCCHDQSGQIKIFALNMSQDKNRSYKITSYKDILTIVLKPRYKSQNNLNEEEANLPRIQINVPKKYKLNYIVDGNSKVSFLNIIIQDISIVALDRASVYFENANCNNFFVTLLDRASLDIETGYINNFSAKLWGRSHNDISCEIGTLSLTNGSTGSMSFKQPVNQIDRIRLKHDGGIHLHNPPAQKDSINNTVDIKEDTRGHIIWGKKEIYGDNSRVKRAKL